ncbi:hypothetical protein NL676_019098 [Syzygium grande]|nr:hypothetical protein NL676_019098 [Syzygium grande]
MADSGAEEKTLEFTPSWVVALVCFSIVLISLAVDRFLLWAGKLLKKSRWEPMFGAFQKIKEELMLLGFISLLLAVFQTRIGKICIPERLANVWLPCKKLDSSSTTARFTNFFRSSEARGRRLLAEAAASTDFCGEKGKVSLLTAEALHHLDIFIFVLATFHVTLCVCKIMLGYWKCSFFKQFYPSVTRLEYQALHLNFMALHLDKRGEDFHSFVTGAVKKDFEKIVGIR